MRVELAKVAKCVSAEVSFCQLHPQLLDLGRDGTQNVVRYLRESRSWCDKFLKVRNKTLHGRQLVTTPPSHPL